MSDFRYQFPSEPEDSGLSPVERFASRAKGIFFLEARELSYSALMPM